MLFLDHQLLRFYKSKDLLKLFNNTRSNTIRGRRHRKNFREYSNIIQDRVSHHRADQWNRKQRDRIRRGHMALGRKGQQGLWEPYRVEDRREQAPFAQEEGPSGNHLANCQRPGTAKPLRPHTILEKAHHPKRRTGYPLPDHTGQGQC